MVLLRRHDMNAALANIGFSPFTKRTEASALHCLLLTANALLATKAHIAIVTKSP